MLVLSRNTNEEIILKLGNGEVIKVTVVKVERNRVKLGLTAPENIKILRSELEDSGN